ncbi:glycosyltransferase family 2 protein [Paracoccus sp. M683]|uniref:glycosyltransferase family 2 protein n=1 Tax=Paracoccus sp. M683 TaxID=2594268 RepID=UPI00163D7141|nr:glycosyltransferase family 2 protein [Paracoccus sp. M683]
MTHERHALMTSIKNEGPYLLEFVAHHRVLGFAQHHFASNDCTDGSDLLLDALAAHGVVTHTRNPVQPGQAPQPTGYARIRAAGHLDGADWIMVMDADEFLQVTIGQGLIQDLTRLAGPETDIVTIHSLAFGTTEDIRWHPGPVTHQFTRRLPGTHRRNAPVKSISRTNLFRSLHNHNPVGFTGGDRPVHVLLGSGERIEIAETGRLGRHLRQRRTDKTSHQIAFYNHYPIKSLESYCLRQQRGDGATPIGDVSGRYDHNYWQSFATAKIEDHSIIDRYGAALTAEMARLLALPGVSQAHAQAENLHRGLLDAML